MKRRSITRKVDIKGDTKSFWICVKEIVCAHLWEREKERQREKGEMYKYISHIYDLLNCVQMCHQPVLSISSQAHWQLSFSFPSNFALPIPSGPIHKYKIFNVFYWGKYLISNKYIVKQHLNIFHLKNEYSIWKYIYYTNEMLTYTVMHYQQHLKPHYIVYLWAARSIIL